MNLFGSFPFFTESALNPSEKDGFNYRFMYKFNLSEKLFLILKTFFFASICHQWWSVMICIPLNDLELSLKGHGLIILMISVKFHRESWSALLDVHTSNEIPIQRVTTFYSAHPPQGSTVSFDVTRGPTLMILSTVFTWAHFTECCDWLTVTVGRPCTDFYNTIQSQPTTHNLRCGLLGMTRK